MGHDFDFDIQYEPKKIKYSSLYFHYYGLILLDIYCFKNHLYLCKSFINNYYCALSVFYLIKLCDLTIEKQKHFKFIYFSIFSETRISKYITIAIYLKFMLTNIKHRLKCLFLFCSGVALGTSTLALTIPTLAVTKYVTCYQHPGPYYTNPRFYQVCNL